MAAAAEAEGARPQQHQRSGRTSSPTGPPAQDNNTGDEGGGSPRAATTRSREPSSRREDESADAEPAEGGDHATLGEADYERNKVFVGNLSYGITEQELEAYFAQIGKVLDVIIVRRRGRPVGFAFVTFENEEVAQCAVSTLDQTVCDGRQISVEVTSSRPRDPKPRMEGRPRPLRNSRPRRRGTNRSQEQDSGVQQNVEDWAGDFNEDNAERHPPRRPRPRRERKPRNKPKGAEAGQGSIGPDYAEPTREDTGELDTKQAGDGVATQKRTRRRRPRKPRLESAGDAAVAESHAADGEQKGRTPRGPRPPRESRKPKGPPSDREIFVSDLPFSMTAEGLADLFSGFRISNARVIEHPGTKRNKGFGLVEMEDHDEQTRVVDELKGDRALQAEGRVLAIRVAFEEAEGNEGGEDNHGEVVAPARIDE